MLSVEEVVYLGGRGNKYGRQRQICHGWADGLAQPINFWISKPRRPWPLSDVLSPRSLDEI